MYTRVVENQRIKTSNKAKTIRVVSEGAGEEMRKKMRTRRKTKMKKSNKKMKKWLPMSVTSSRKEKTLTAPSILRRKPRNFNKTEMIKKQGSYRKNKNLSRT